MSWVLIGHAYTNWMQGIFVNNPNVSRSKNTQTKEVSCLKLICVNLFSGCLSIWGSMENLQWFQTPCQALIPSFWLVSYFFLSIIWRCVSFGATLLSYLTLKELDKNNGGSLKFWIMFIVHRYIRCISNTITCSLYCFLGWPDYMRL